MLLIGSCFNLPSYTTKDNLLSDGTNHFGRGQDNFSHKCHLIWAIPQLRAPTHTLFKSVFNCFLAQPWSLFPPFLPVPPLQHHLFHPPLESSALCAQKMQCLSWISTKQGTSSFTKAKNFPVYWAGQDDPVGGAGSQKSVTASEPVSDPTARNPTREPSSTTHTYMQSF